MSAYRQERSVRLSVDLADTDGTAPPLARPRVGVIWGAFGATTAVMAVILGCTSPPLIAALTIAASLMLGGWLILRSLRTRTARERMGDDWEARRHREVCADETAFEVADSRGRTRLAWPHVVAWTESEFSFFVFPNAFSFHVLPKAAFGTPESLTTFRQLLSERVDPTGPSKIAAQMRRRALPMAWAVVLLMLLVAGVGELLARALF